MSVGHVMSAAILAGILIGGAAFPAPARAAGWSYEQRQDQMRGSSDSFASLDSLNDMSFGFPYSDGKATLRIRQRSQDGLNILLIVNGQFVCHSESGVQLSVKFDSGPIETYPCSGSADGSSGLLFIDNEPSFLQKLKQSKRLIIEAQFYNVGPRQMIFNTQGLVWPPQDFSGHHQ